MKYKFIVSIFCIYFSNSISSQAPAIQWQKTYGGTNGDSHSDVQQASDGGYIHIGTSSSNNGNVTGNHGNGDIWVLKTNSTGDISWQKALGGTEGEHGYSIRPTSDGGYILAGETQSSNGDVTGNNGFGDYWIIKLDASGNIQWQKNFGGTNTEVAQSIKQTDDGGYIVAGYKNMVPPGTSPINNDYWLIKLDTAGNIQWQNTYGSSIGLEEANSIEQTSDGGYIVAGSSSSPNDYVLGNHGSSDYWIIKINATGALQWQKSLGGSAIDKAKSIIQTSDGGYIVVGSSNSTNGDVTVNYGNFDYWVVKLSATGNILWQKSFGGSGNDTATGVDSTTDGGCIIIGTSNSPHKDSVTLSQDYWVIKLNASGNLEWDEFYGGTSTEWSSSIEQTSDGGYILGGHSNVAGNSDYWIIKLAGSLLNTNENIIKNNILIYPNPSKDFVTLDHLPNGAAISIHDLLGRKILNKKYSETKVTINTSIFSNGTYVIQVDDEGKTVLSEKLLIKR